MQPHYTHDEEGYHLHMRGESFPMGEQIAMVFDTAGPLSKAPGGAAVLLRHGQMKQVCMWYGDSKSQLEIAGETELCRAWVLVAGKLDVDEVNKCLSITGYRPSFLTPPASEVDAMAAENRRRLDRILRRNPHGEGEA